ncbi:MAG: hypothetical protein C4519_22255 [Desulfobacteraceae bacterium]|nr:MAG: hypothetical protein C4519_22255 [Desulfobacteraceae bacterium]
MPGPSSGEEKKRAIFDGMSPRRQKHILKRGYENWDPFEVPKDPIDIRRDVTQRTTQQLVREFLQQCGHAKYSNAYGRGVLEMALGIINCDDRFIGMFEFAVWYTEQLRRLNSEGEDVSSP